MKYFPSITRILPFRNLNISYGKHSDPHLHNIEPSTIPLENYLQFQKLKEVSDSRQSPHTMPCISAYE